MPDIYPDDLIALFQGAIDQNWGYIYGMTHEKWSKEKQENYKNRYAGDADRAMSCKYGGKWAGHWVTDCSGLFTWAFNELGGKMYHGSNTMYNSWCTDKGSLKSGQRTDGKPLLPGTAVFVYKEAKKKRTHVGLYIGNGIVIEAKGAQFGVVTSSVTADKWTDWGELKGVVYGDAPEPEPVPEGYAVVTGKNLALRQGPGTDMNVITRIPIGTKVKLADLPDGWTYVQHNGKYGFVMDEYIRKE